MARPNANPLIPGVPDVKVVSFLKRFYPGMSTSILSMLKHPDRYASELIDEAKERLADHFGYEAIRPRRRRASSGHRFTRRAGCRLSDERAELFEQCIRSDPKYKAAPYMSKVVEDLIDGYIKRRTKARAKRRAA
jgi:hypothetical protein